MWKDKRVLVTGGSGFLGRVIVEKLVERGAQVEAPRKAEFDLRDFTHTVACLMATHPQVVIHSAAYYGGIGINKEKPGEVYFDKTYEGNPLVNAFCLGVLRHEQIARGQACGIGNPVFYVGPATGRLKSRNRTNMRWQTENDEC